MTKRKPYPQNRRGNPNYYRPLDERDRDILRSRAAGETLERIAARYGVSRERVRQLAAAAERRAKVLGETA